MSEWQATELLNRCYGGDSKPSVADAIRENSEPRDVLMASVLREAGVEPDREGKRIVLSLA